MPEFSEHITQAKHNLQFLQDVNNTFSCYWDWQVTICFYVAVHLVNAHLSKTCNQHYRKHTEVFNAISPYRISHAKFSEDDYFAFLSLYNLSRRSRYLISENTKDHQTKPFFTHEKHFSKSIKHLDRIIGLMKAIHKVQIPEIKIKSSFLGPHDLKNFSTYA